MDRSVEQLVDEILVMDAQDGKARAMEILVSRWQKRLWKYAYRLTGNSEGAWDVTQETWLGIIKGLRKLNDPEFKNHHQEGKKDADIKELLQKLDMKKRAVISLFYFEELSVPEISVALKIPNGTVKSRLTKARKELKELYQNYFE